MGNLSVFVDESGDFGEYSFHSPYYIITMLFHNQTQTIDAQVQKLNRELKKAFLKPIKKKEFIGFNAKS